MSKDAHAGHKPPVWRVLGLASVLAAMPLVTGLPQVSTPASPHPVKSTRHQVGFVKSSVAAMRAARTATSSAVSTPGAPDPITTARAGAVTAAQNVTDGVAVVGVTWPKNAVSTPDQFQIRTLTGAAWSQWQTFGAEEADGPDPTEATAAGAVKGTSPYVVTGASKFEVRSLTTDLTAPIAATVQVVDPGASNADSAQPAAGAASAATAKPAIYSRAAWGANERLRRAAPEYGQVQLGFVHHTVSSNSYTAAQVPAMIRGIYAYHVQSNGWSDIGYNFLIDRFGRTWEGRYGGMNKPVIGAQTLNYNAWSMGVSAIGNFEVASPPQAMTNAFKRVFAWKLSLSGLPATGTVVANGKSFQRVSGHRDGFKTACPGRYLFAKVPEIRAGAAAIIGSLPRATINRDIDRNGTPDALSYTPAGAGVPISTPVSVLATAQRTPVRGGVALNTGWNGLRNVTLSPDLSGDGKADVIAQDPAGNRLRIYLGNGRGFSGVLYRGKGWNGITRLIAVGDHNRDGRNDIMATKSNGDLVFYPGDGAGWVGTARIIGHGWNTISTFTNAGDLNHDQIPDLLGTRRSDGALFMYAGQPDGSLAGRVQWGSRWGALSAVVGGSDLDGDAYPDVYARLGGGMITYATDASGHWARTTKWGSGWNAMSQLSTGADFNGDGVADLMAVRTAVNRGTMMLYAGTGLRDFTTRAGAFPAVPGADHVRLAGDVDGDGYVDAVARVSASDSLVLMRGLPGSTFAAPIVIAGSGSGWNAFDLLETAGDYDYDGVPDLLARDTSGMLFVYPFSRNGSFKARLTVGTGGWQGMLSVTGAGAFNSDANGDVMALRASDHSLIFYRGDGPTALQDPVVLMAAQNDLAQIMGVGDYNGDGRADLMARATDGLLWLYPGNGAGALGGRQPVRGGEGAGHVLG